MSDEERTLPEQAQVEGSQVAAAETIEQPGQVKEPQFLTHEEAARLKQEIINEARSYSDKGRIKLQQHLQAVEAAIKTAESFGKPFSDADKTELRQQARVAAVIVDADDETAQVPQTTEQAQAAGRELYAHDLRMQGRYGIELVPTDPEAATLKIVGDPVKDKATIEAAFKAKRDRLASTNQTQIDEASKAGVRLGVTPGAKPTTTAKSASEYWANAHKK